VTESRGFVLLFGFIVKEVDSNDIIRITIKPNNSTCSTVCDIILFSHAHQIASDDSVEPLGSEKFLKVQNIT